MAEQRRSIRARKSVNYAKFSGGGSDEDDFADSSTPPTKRSKTEKTERLKNVKKEKRKINETSMLLNRLESQHIQVESKIIQNLGQEAPHQRLSVSDKVFQRHLETAIQISNREKKSVVPDIKKETVNEKQINKDYLDEKKDKRSAEDQEGDSNFSEDEGPSPECFKENKTEKKNFVTRKGID
ncbi:RAD51-associated protein 1-like isoform X2 [Limulus polyphemus]|uniref:RAD51-associated protein 1-like isoform X2 n=1 Tax=Limulus polyphemus TaxID=6850 RepID=A0ABM1SBJ7_LIMPO|nr:RAD51-associated protein 1-like isoform X2 [Limulus polyphemus]